MDTNKMRDISREQFEVWARDENKWLIDRDSFGNYIYGFVRDSWNSWQASREAVVVELPNRPYASEADQDQMTDYEIGIGHGGCEEWDKIREKIKAQGLKVAP